MERTEEEAARGHEKRDADARAALGLGLLAVGLSVVALLAMWSLFHFLVEREASRDVPPSPLAETRAPFIGPRLQVSPPDDVAEMRANEEQILSSYGWADRDAGTVRIPIERAMDLLVERGLPARQGETPPREER